MSKTDKKFNQFLGYKFFRYIEETEEYDVIRIIHIEEFNEKFKIMDKNGKVSIINYTALKQKYKPLDPKGFLMISSVWIGSKENRFNDIIVAAYDKFRAKELREFTPYCICRQSVNDVFYTVIQTDPNLSVVGCCISQDSCPPNVNLADLLACDGLYKDMIVNFYLDDTLETIFQCIDTSAFDAILEGLFEDHMIEANKNNPFFSIDACELRQHNGWCRTLRGLLVENSFITDLDSMRNVQALDFDLSKHIVESEEDTLLDDEVNWFLSKTYRMAIKESRIIKYDYDINIADFDNTNHLLFRDTTDTTYLVVFVLEGQFLEADLEKKYNQLSISDEIRLAFYNKYSQYQKN